jgi:hypothetical protein
MCRFSSLRAVFAQSHHLSIAAARRNATVLSRPRLTVANMTALDEFRPTLDSGSPRLTVPLLRPSEAADLLSVRLGRHIRFTREMLEAWLVEQHAA